MAIPLDLIQSTAAARIAALPASAYAQGTGVTAAWNEAVSPFGSLDDQGDATTHLDFAVFVTSAASGRSRYVPGDDGEFAGLLSVVFRWDIDPGDQRGSYRLAMRAAHDVIVSLNRDEAWANVGEVQTVPRDRFTAAMLPGVLSMEVTVSLDFTYSEGV
jgi:hypothetical protein